MNGTETKSPQRFEKCGKSSVVLLNGAGEASILGVLHKLITLMARVGPFGPFELAVKLGFDVIASGGFHGLKLQKVAGLKFILVFLKGLKPDEPHVVVIHG